MGFDINIQMVLMICPYSGKPFYYRKEKNTNELVKVFGIPDITVPEELRRFLSFKNNIMAAYTENLPTNGLSATVDEFLEYFPTWEDILLGNFFDEYSHWSQKEHYSFKALLEWCNEQDVCFQVTWSY